MAVNLRMHVYVLYVCIYLMRCLLGRKCTTKWLLHVHVYLKRAQCCTFVTQLWINAHHSSCLRCLPPVLTEMERGLWNMMDPKQCILAASSLAAIKAVCSAQCTVVCILVVSYYAWFIWHDCCLFSVFLSMSYPFSCHFFHWGSFFLNRWVGRWVWNVFERVYATCMYRLLNVITYERCLTRSVLLIQRQNET